MNLIEITTAAYNAGLAGQPEPAKVTKHVQMTDSETGQTVTGQVETEASLRIRMAWAQGNSPASLFEVWIAKRLANVEQKLAEMNFHAGQCDWLCYGEAGHDSTTARPAISGLEGLSPASIHGGE